ncbi:MAG: hypothetical protein M3P33_02745, partial [bacterium]|nr:hypothetical protein [bacterium]
TSIINFKPETKNLGQLVPQSGSWGVSAPTDIRTNSVVLAQADNIPLLIARTYGKGKVLWSGMNIIPHIEGNKNENEKEMLLLKQSLRWLVNINENTSPNSQLKITTKRASPDELNFTFQEGTKSNTTLYFRESYYPKWQANLKDLTGKTKNTPVYRAGPRMIGIRVPQVNQGDTLQLKIKATNQEIMLNLLGITTVLYLLLFTIGITQPIELFILTKIRVTLYNIANNKANRTNFKIHNDPNS